MELVHTVLLAVMAVLKKLRIRHQWDAPEAEGTPLPAAATGAEESPLPVAPTSAEETPLPVAGGSHGSGASAPVFLCPLPFLRPRSRECPRSLAIAREIVSGMLGTLAEQTERSREDRVQGIVQYMCELGGLDLMDGEAAGAYMQIS